MDGPPKVSFAPIMSMPYGDRAAFENIGIGLGVWPEVGSRMTLQLTDGMNLAGGWVKVEAGRYRYALDWLSGITVRTVIWEYLATETYWAPQ